ncbi:helix-turn-helix transcriptional regulator [Actinoplanes sp. CA-131856]
MRQCEGADRGGGPEFLDPADLGLPAIGRRRAAGLRREELAQLAGVSVDYLVRLEQGRSARPSESVAEALARALHLDTAEREHLYRLARLAVPGPGRISAHIPPSVQRLLAGLSDQALGVFAADWTLITWTPLWASLVGDPGRLAPDKRNLVFDTFLPGVALSGWPVEAEHGPEAFEAALVADLRVTHSKYTDEPRLRRLIAECSRGSERFASLWALLPAAGEFGHDRKRIAHPIAGEIVVDCDVLTVPGSDIRIIAFTAAAGTRAAEQLDFLRVSAVKARFVTDVTPTDSRESRSGR